MSDATTGAANRAASTPRSAAADVVAAVAELALSFPEAWSDNPWDESVVKVRKKIFLFHSSPGSERSIVTVKVPESLDHARSLPGASPTGYGLGKHAWTTFDVDRLEPDVAEVLFDFVEESYRTVAPKTLVRQLDASIVAESSDD